MTAVDKMVNQPGTKHHGIVAKLKQDSARSEGHRRATTTVKRFDVNSNHDRASDDDGDVLVTVMNKRTN